MKRCLVALAHNGPVVFTQTARSLMELGWGDRVERAKAAHGFDEISFLWSGSFPRVDTMRDWAMASAMAEGFTHVLFLDADMVWPSDVLVKMLAHHDKGIVGGLYVLKGPPYAPVALGAKVDEDNGVERYAWQTEYGTELVPVSVLGMGCTLVPVSVCQQMPRPWFEYRHDGDGWPNVSEDVPFCQKAAALGVPILLDPTVKCGHVTTQTIDERWHHRYQQSVRESETRPVQVRVA